MGGLSGNERSVAVRASCVVLAASCVVLFLVGLPARYAEQAATVGRLALVAGSRHDAATLTIYSIVTFALEVLASLGFFVVAAIIVWRCWRDAAAVFVALLLTAFGAALSGTAYALLHSLPIWRAPAGVLQALGWFLLLIFAYVFPTGSFVPHWTRWLVPVWAVWVVAFFRVADALQEQSILFVALSFAIWVLWLGTGVLAQLYRYRYVSSPGQRQQTKWVVFGFALALLGAGAATVPHILSLATGHADSLDIVYRLAAVAAMCLTALAIPLAVGLAILRYHLFDIDKLINRALVYGSLTALHVCIYLISVLALESLLRTLTGQTSNLVLVVATLITISAFRPLRARIQGSIDRRFYRRKYNATRVLDHFSASLRHEVDLAHLREHLMGVVNDTMEPAHISLWLMTPASRRRRPE